MLASEVPLTDRRQMLRVKGIPRPKPRQTNRDRWAPSKSVLDYRFWADLIRLRWRTVYHSPPWEGGIALSCVFEFPIPAGWTKAKRALAEAGDLSHTSPPDLDNLVKGVADALNKIAWRDDCQVMSYVEPTQKLWAPPEQEGVWITVEYLGDY